MIVLGIDTATRFGSVGILAVSGAGAPERGGTAPGPEVLAEVSRDEPLNHGVALLPLIDQCLDRAGRALEDVDAIAVSIGPGSFTGLRVGLATAKGLALAGGGVLVGVPTLEALAATVAASQTGLVCACLDARKGEVYAALFATAGGRAGEPAAVRLSPDRASSPAAMIDGLELHLGEVPDGARHGVARVAFIGDGAGRYAAMILARLGASAEILPPARFHPRGSVVAALGARRLAERGADDVAALAPLYARASQAEEAHRARGEAPGLALTREIRPA